MTVERIDAESLKKAMVCDAVLDRVGHCDAAHWTHAAIVERAQSNDEVFLQARLCYQRGGAQDQCIVDPTFYAQVNEEASEGILAHQMPMWLPVFAYQRLFPR